MKMSKRIFKSAITLFVMSAMMFSVSLWPSVQGTTGASQLKIRIPIKITITFGRASKKCAGFGVCKITLGLSSASATGRSVNAELSAIDDGKLQIALLGKPPEEGRTLFIDEDIPLSQEIAQKLGVRNATIQRGEYAFSANKSVLNARLTK